MDMPLAAAQELMRRAEVTIGAVSARHLQVDPGRHVALSRPHGYDIISRRIHEGNVDIGALAAPKVYAQPAWGFWGAYDCQQFCASSPRQTTSVQVSDSTHRL